MLKKLAALGLVEHAPYKGATLTPDGERIALEVIRHHRLLEQYLAETLGLSIDEVHDEADRLEHVLSDELERRIDEALGFPDARSARGSDPGRGAERGRTRRCARSPRSSRARRRRFAAFRATTRRCSATSRRSRSSPAAG